MPKQPPQDRPSRVSSGDESPNHAGALRDEISPKERQAFRRSQVVSAKTTRDVMAKLRKQK